MKQAGYRQLARLHPFSPDERWLPCPTCLAPMSVPFKGQQRRCDSCTSSVAAPPEPDLSVTKFDAAERTRRLQTLTGDPSHIHPEAVPLVCILERDRAEVLALWQKARRKLLDDAADDDAALLMFSITTSLLRPMPIGPEHDASRRALLQAAVELIEHPRLRQRLLGSLVSHAARQGDAASAKSWLKRMDPHSDDRLMSSAYRYARCWIATVDEQFDEVLRLSESEAQPITAQYLNVMSLLRANALVLSGERRAATKLLQANAKTSGDALAWMELRMKMMSLKACAPLLRAVRRRRLVRTIGDAWGCSALLGFGLLACYVAQIFIDDGFSWVYMSLGLVAIAGIVVGWLRWAQVATMQIDGSEPVFGRVLACRSTRFGHPNSIYCMRRLDGREVTIETQLVPPAPLTHETVVGKSLVGYWNPEQPDKLMSTYIMTS